MKQTLDCPYCEGVAELTAGAELITVKGVTDSVLAFFYKCSSCGTEFTTTESDEETLSQLNKEGT
jgi:C4-type Zn-finger protein